MTNNTANIDAALAAYIVDGPERVAEVVLTKLALHDAIDLGRDVRRVGDARSVKWSTAPTAQNLGMIPTVSVCGPLPGDATALDLEVYELIGREPSQTVVRLLDRIPALESALAVITRAAELGFSNPQNDRRTRAGKAVVRDLKDAYPLFTTGYDDIVMALAVRGPVVMARVRPEITTALTSRGSASSTRSV